MRYRLKAVGPAGQVEALDVEGFDEASVVRQAKERGYTVLALRPRAPLARACPGRRAAFPPSVVATVQAAETTGDVAPSLQRYASYQKQADALRKRVAAASICPALLLAAGGLVTLFLLLYVVPRFSAIFEERGTALPFF